MYVLYGSALIGNSDSLRGAAVKASPRGLNERFQSFGKNMMSSSGNLPTVEVHSVSFWGPLHSLPCTATGRFLIPGGCSHIGVDAWHAQTYSAITSSCSNVGKSPSSISNIGGLVQGVMPRRQRLLRRLLLRTFCAIYQ